MKNQNHSAQNLLSDALNFFYRKRKMNNYDVQEEILQMTVKLYPRHDNYAAVDVKVKLLNLFYSTGIKAIDKVTKKIMSIKNIDTILNEKKHSKDLVDKIAELELKEDKRRTNYSFATKYCALHKPDKYPIYDSIVGKVFTKLFFEGKLYPYVYTRKKIKAMNEMTKTEFENKLHNYDFFVEVYNHFMRDYGLTTLSYRQVDWYLWGSYKDGNHKSKIEELAPLKEGVDYIVLKQKVIDQTITI